MGNDKKQELELYSKNFKEGGGRKTSVDIKPDVKWRKK